MFFIYHSTSHWYPINKFSGRELKRCSGRHFLGYVCDIMRIHNLNIVGLLETRISDLRAHKVIEKLGFDGVARFDAHSFFGGICCLWKMNIITTEVISISTQCV